MEILGYTMLEWMTILPRTLATYVIFIPSDIFILIKFLLLLHLFCHFYKICFKMLFINNHSV